mmetsp:Transcript_6430/g.11210  ORF Transcript_6430/g.11210 Transcript_6430/m.11210 type:complete len:243 (-) Transcript_6430:11-739(-)
MQTIKKVDEGPLQRKRISKLHIATLGRGELIGISELIDKKQRKHCCICSSSSGKLIRINAEDFESRVLPQNYKTLKEIYKVKKTTYEAREQNMKLLTLEPLVNSSVEQPVRSETPTKSRQIRYSRPKLKSFDKSIDFITPRLSSFDRTMTNLTQRPDSFELLRTKLSTVVSPKRSKVTTKPCNIHMQAIKSKCKRMFRAKVFAPYSSTVTEEFRNTKIIDVSSLVKSFTIEQGDTRRSMEKR